MDCKSFPSASGQSKAQKAWDYCHTRLPRAVAPWYIPVPYHVAELYSLDDRDLQELREAFSDYAAHHEESALTGWHTFMMTGSANAESDYGVIPRPSSSFPFGNGQRLPRPRHTIINRAHEQQALAPPRIPINHAVQRQSTAAPSQQVNSPTMIEKSPTPTKKGQAVDTFAAAPGEKRKKPANGWINFRNAHIAEMRAKHPGASQQKISGMISDLYHSMTDDEVQPYFDEAARIAGTAPTRRPSGTNGRRRSAKIKARAAAGKEKRQSG
ncbi:hypothetical protein F5Y16DRAFT_405831 [Xylariaceae sp. FL0255]|nr:hypothetical protein F5Y16DRAFT_405831 [Xylariaceae sp. FL0255]